MNKIPKAAIRRIEVATRKEMRQRNKDHEFIRRSLIIYNGQSVRAEKQKKDVPFTLEEFRTWLKPFVGEWCACGKRLTMKALSVDHNIPVSRDGSYALDNLVCRCKQCNLRKGAVLPGEFQQLLDLVNTFTPESKEDIFRRLVLGGKWTFKSK